MYTETKINISIHIHLMYVYKILTHNENIKTLKKETGESYFM